MPTPTAAPATQPPETLDPRDLPPEALAVAHRFLGDGGPLAVQPWGDGLINLTCRVDVAAGPRAGAYILQRINPAVFPDPDGIMANLGRLAAALAAQPDAGLTLPSFLPGDDGAPLVRDQTGAPWRLARFITPSRGLKSLANSAQARETGRMLGAFHRLGATLEPAAMALPLPGFHDTPAYLAALDAQVAADPAAARAPRVAAALTFVEDRRGLVPVLADARAGGLLPVRVTHGDPKLDNLLFAPDADRALCLIDLDTVQPGLIHHDLADCLRSCCNRRGEAAPAQAGGAAAVRFDADLARHILGGYAGAVAGLLSPAEIDLLWPAIRLLPLELGMRFLTDHLAGDRWFRVAYRGQNMDKAEIQFALAADVEAREPAVRAAIAGAFGGGDSTHHRWV